MNTQNTPVHIHLWHREFWMMVFANMLLGMAVTILIPTFPLWMLHHEGLTTFETGLAMALFGVGVFVPGFMCSYLVQHYRRNSVCIWAIAFLALMILLPIYLHPFSPMVAMLIRFGQGVAFGLAQLVLASTLVIDTCESFNRTEANHAATWFGRFALSLGPVVGLLAYQFSDARLVFWIAAGCGVLAAFLILTIRFPFRVPSDHVCKFSFDRFLLLRGWPLLLNMVPVMIAVGMVFSRPLSVSFYAFIMVGFLLALLAQRFVFPDAELKSEVVSGLMLISSALLILLVSPASPLVAPLLGLGLGIMGSRFLLFFIKLSRHCQRGTAQSTFLLGWEIGLALGIGLGYMYFDDVNSLLLVALLLVGASLLLYVVYIHRWFIASKNR